MKLGKTEQAILEEMSSENAERFGWRYEASYDRASPGRRQTNACRKLATRGLVNIIHRDIHQVYFGPKQGMVRVFSITIELKPEYRAWARLGGFRNGKA